MSELTDWRDLPIAGTVSPAGAPRPATGAWRTGQKPAVDLAQCVDCLLCWLYCPDSAILLDGTAFAGFDYAYCKGCEICADRCPTAAITMVAEETPVSERGSLS
jgi:2-oxoacid:acceptor oxidoreductase delta subunit (pyruvate/2-ketoisovalerate family)